MNFLESQSAFPSAQPSFPGTAPVPLFGVTPDEEQLGALLPNLLGTPTATGASQANLTNRAGGLVLLGDLTGGAIGPDNDPAEWTPDEAAAQTDRALARIGQANPELAQMLAQSRGKSEGEDLPWYKDILKGVGEVLHATKLDVVFDYLGRASHIIPEVVKDWGKESAWTNAWQAISGQEQTNWNEVFQKWGWDEGGLGGFVRATLGLMGDIATDPLTYLTFGAGAVGRAAIGKTTGTAAIEAALQEGRIGVRAVAEAGEAAGESLIRYGDEAVDLGGLLGTLKQAHPDLSLNDMARGIMGWAEGGQLLSEKGGAGLLSRLRSALGMAHPDARPGIALTLDNMGSSDALRQLIRLGDDAVRASTTQGWSRVTALAAEKMGVPKSTVDTILRRYVSEGTGIGVDKTLYRAGKEAAGALGGARIRFSIPVLNIRAAGMKLPMLPARMDFSLGRRFFAGLSGQVKLLKMVGEGAATMEDMRIFWEGGWSKLRELNPRVAREVGHGVASMYYTASEKVGQATQMFSPHHAQLRGGGLAATFSGQVANQAKHIGTQTKDEMQTITLQSGEVLRPAQALNRLGVAMKNMTPEQKVEFGDQMNRLVNLVPEPGVSAWDYWEKRISEFNLAARRRGEDKGAAFEEAMATMRHQQEEAVKAERAVAELAGGDAAVGEIWRGVSRNRDDILTNAGLTPDQYNAAVTQASNLHPDDAAAESIDGNVYTSEQVLGGDSEVGANNLADVGSSGVAVRGLHGTLRGKLGDAVPPVEQAAPEPNPLMEELRAVLNASVAEEQSAEAVAEGADILRRSQAATAPEPLRLENLNTADTPEVAASKRAAKKQAFEAGTDPGYVYHYAPGDNLNAIREGGLSPSKPADVTPPGPAGVYFGDTAEQAYNLLPMKSARGAVPLRVRRSDAIEATSREGITGESISRGAINPEDVEYLDASGTWRPLVEPTPAATVVEGATYGPMHVLAATSPEMKDAVAQRLHVLTPEERAYLDSPQMVLTGPQRTLDIDRSTIRPGEAREATHVVDEIAEIHASYQPILDQIEAGTLPELDDLPDDVADDIMDIVTREGGKEAQLADLTTKVLQSRGYTGVRIKTDEGVEFVAFYDEAAGTVPFARVNPRAARLTHHGGSQLRALTPQVREAVMGQSRSRGQSIISRILRATKDASRGDAETAARRILAEEKITLRESQSVFETDPLRILEEASSETASRVAQEFTGQAIRHGENLGLLRGGYGTGRVGMGTLRVVLNEGDTAVGAVAEAGTARRQAEEVVARLADKVIPSLKARADDLADQTQLANQALDALRASKEARLQAMITRIAGKQTLGDIDEEYLSELIENRQSEIDRLLAGAPFTGDRPDHPSIEKFELMEKGGTKGAGDYYEVHRVTFKNSEEYYYYLDETGKVRGVREVTPSKGYLGNVPQENRHVLAYNDPDWNGRGIGSKLLDIDWRERGFFSGTYDEQFQKMSTATATQTFSAAGAALNTSAVKRHADRILKEAKAEANRLKEEVERTQREMNLASTQLQNDRNELQKLLFRQSNARAPLLAALVPAENARNLTGMEVLDIPGFQEFSMPLFMAEEFKRGMHGYPKLNGPHQAFRQLNNFWKQFATWLVPGFHIRNLEGAFFNNWLGGVGIKDYVSSARIRYAEREIARGNLKGKWATALIRKADPQLFAGIKHGNPWGYMNGVPIEDLTYADLANMTAGLNINASNGRAFAEAQLTAEEQTRRVEKAAKGGRKQFIKRIPSPYTKLMRGTGTMTENWMRGAGWLRGLREGRSVMESRAFTMMRHGDYEDMTDAEFLWVRDLIPFYKWMRTNTPFQIHQLLESPGKLLAVQKAQRAVYDARGLNYENERHKMPSWMTEGFTVPYNIGEEDGQTVFDTVMLDLPMSDLFMGGREFVSSFLPLVRPFLESYVFQKSTFSGKPLEGKQVPVNPLFGPLLPVLDAVGLISRGPDGQATMSDKTQNLLGIIPLYSRFKNFIFEDGKSATKRAQMVASGVFGLGLRPVDLETITDTELSFYYDQVLPTVEYLRGVGYELPTTQDLEDTIGTTDSILARLGIKPGLVMNAA